MIYFLWFQVETTSVKKRDIRFIAGKDDYTKSLSVIKTPSIFVQWIEINSHFLTDAIVRNSMTFNLIQSINLQRPFLGMESLTKTMGSLRFGQWHRRSAILQRISVERQNSIGIFAEIRQIMVRRQTPKAAPITPTMHCTQLQRKGFHVLSEKLGRLAPKSGR